MIQQSSTSPTTPGFVSRALSAACLLLFSALPSLAQKPQRPVVPHNAEAADTTNADQLRDSDVFGLRVKGAGVVVGIWDGGAIRDSHVEFEKPAGGSRVTIVDDVPVSSHATHVAGTIGAKGADSAAKGMAPRVGIRSYNNGDDTNEMARDAHLIDLSNHSYGPGAGWTNKKWSGNRSEGTEDTAFGRYDSTSMHVDRVLYDNPWLLSVWSAGNERLDAGPTGDTYEAFFGNTTPTSYIEKTADKWYVVSTAVYPKPAADGNGGTGYDSLTGGGSTAKNTLVVGAMNAHTTDPHQGNAMEMSDFSSYGGTDDGRLGVDVVANGVGLYSSDSSSDDAYGWKSGTSMSAPNVTGTAALLIEHFRNEKQELNLKVRSATQKGYLMHTATDVTNGTKTPSGRKGPDYATGYGMVNAAAAAGFITEALTTPADQREQWLFEETKTDDTQFEMLFKATGGQVKATLSWTDPAGEKQVGTYQELLDNRTPRLVNDLDLWISVGETIYYPWTLDIENPANAAVRNKANHVDVTEQVLIDLLPADSLFTLHVGQTGLLDDVLGGGLQDFSLLLSGAELIAVPEPTSITLLLGLLGWTLGQRRRREPR